ncbi:sugar phosphate isomerase/epimerase [Halobacillus sp. BBL2006]|uniref:sugar phosphate isomerase/epimerase family protein n=1 Tax=Halobacillus sp. BBL2006 TaxID=1543706 RepID=UPI000543E8AD|nr:sugar phosphate isomerase/epimerase [Halobacillus sp. BBL2006]KHE71859.1 xylose isomerase [Halobacillus sp. BBL2006]
MTSIPVAVQMYTLRNESAEDFAGTLEKVAKLGFDGVEFAGFGGLSAEKVRELLDQLGLKAASSHVPLEELKHNLPRVIEEQKTIGSRYVVCPYITERTEEDYKALVQDLENIGEECRKEGITLCYHNHDFELERLADGRTALETLLEDTSSENVHAEFDVYWLQKAGQDPLSWLKRYQERTPLVHLKDMTKDEEQFFAELGTGGVDVNQILNHGDTSNIDWWIVEQDESRISPLESLEISMNYLKVKLPHLQK